MSDGPDFTPRFPPWLNAGSKGDAVINLQDLCIMLGYATENLIPDGEYTVGGETVASVKNMQRDLGFEGDDVDGNFGRGTRLALFQTTGIDVDALPLRIGQSTTWVDGDGVNQGEWSLAA